jgi:hypothetical protein
MINYCKITKPIYGIVDIEVNDLIKELKNRLRQSKADSRHFNHKCVKFAITEDDEGNLWISGYTKKDLE